MRLKSMLATRSIEWLYRLDGIPYRYECLVVLLQMCTLWRIG
jgi:hypothetical protein